MVVVGKNLSELIEQYNMVDRKDCFDETGIKLSLGNTYATMSPTKETTRLVYGEQIPKDCVSCNTVPQDGLILPPKSSVLACSAETVYMPKGYMGFLQTKGSLARLFVSLHFSDGQIDSGFKGKVTFEIFNGSDFEIVIRRLQPVGNLYVLKASTKEVNEYNGQYAGKHCPTIQAPFQ